MDNLENIEGSDFSFSTNGVLSQRPYIAKSGPNRGKAVVARTTGQLDANGQFEMAEQIVSNATLRYDEWVSLDSTLLESARERLVIVGDLMAAGMTHNVGGLGTLVSEWETSSEMTDAVIDMDGNSKGKKDGQEFGIDGVPMPVIHKEFEIQERMLLASRSRGASLDTTRGREASRSVARTSERLVFNGSNVTSKGSDRDRRTIYGLTNHPSRSTETINDWTDSATTPEEVLGDILEMLSKLETEQRSFGKVNIYIPGNMLFQFRRDLKANSDKTLMQRVLAEDRINAVKVSDAMTAGNVIMVEMSSSVIDLAIASDLTTVQWQSGNKWVNNFQVFAAWAPRIKPDYDGRLGILHATV